jgi:hypothetical protein
MLRGVSGCRVRALKNGGYAVESFLAGKPSWEDVRALMAIEVRERLSPAARLIPSSNPFESQPELPVVPWQMGAYLTNEKARADTAFRQGGDARVVRFIFDYVQPDGSSAVGWMGPNGVLYHVRDPSVLAETNVKVQQLLQQPYREREVQMGHKDLIPSMMRIEGGVERQQITRVRINVALSLLVLIANDVEPDDVTTATMFQACAAASASVLHSALAHSVVSLEVVRCICPIGGCGVAAPEGHITECLSSHRLPSTPHPSHLPLTALPTRTSGCVGRRLAHAPSVLVGAAGGDGAPASSAHAARGERCEGDPLQLSRAQRGGRDHRARRHGAQVRRFQHAQADDARRVVAHELGWLPPAHACDGCRLPCCRSEAKPW